MFNTDRCLKRWRFGLQLRDQTWVNSEVCLMKCTVWCAAHKTANPTFLTKLPEKVGCFLMDSLSRRAFWNGFAQLPREKGSIGEGSTVLRFCNKEGLARCWEEQSPTLTVDIYSKKCIVRFISYYCFSFRPFWCLGRCVWGLNCCNSTKAVQQWMETVCFARYQTWRRSCSLAFINRMKSWPDSCVTHSKNSRSL